MQLCRHSRRHPFQGRALPLPLRGAMGESALPPYSNHDTGKPSDSSNSSTYLTLRLAGEGDDFAKSQSSALLSSTMHPGFNPISAVRTG